MNVARGFKRIVSLLVFTWIGLFAIAALRHLSVWGREHIAFTHLKDGHYGKSELVGTVCDPGYLIVYTADAITADYTRYLIAFCAPGNSFHPDYGALMDREAEAKIALHVDDVIPSAVDLKRIDKLYYTDIADEWTIWAVYFFGVLIAIIGSAYLLGWIVSGFSDKPVKDGS